MESVVDLEILLEPIAGPNPSGRSLAYESEYDALKEARRADDSERQGEWERATKSAEWDLVVTLATECLREKSKDLQIAAWLTEALAQLHGFAGIRAGFTLLRELVARFWDTLYPEIEDGDLGWRAAPLEFLGSDKILPVLIRSIPLTNVMGEKRYSLVRYQESRATDNLARKDPNAVAALLADGKITGEQFDEAVAQTPRRYVESLHADLVSAQEAFKALDALLDERFGRAAPSLSGVRKAFEEVRRVLDPILRKKREQEPDREPESEPEPEAGEEVEQQEESQAGAETEVAELEGSAAAVRRRKPKARGAAGPIGSVEEAIERILDAAAYLRQHEPASPVPYVVVRALRMAEVYPLGQPPDPSGLAAPASATRQALKRLASAGDWAQVLEQAEQALSRPEGRAWLDAQRYALSAMVQAGDADRSAAVAACKALLRGFLADFPDLPRAELSDDTPTANAETRTWLETEILPAAAAAPPPVSAYEPPPQPAPLPTDDGSDAEPDAWTLAVADLRAGRAGEGFQRLRRAVLQATSGRERFRRKLQLAELCLMSKTPRAALPLLEELARQVDEFRLEQWEDEELCARVWGALYRCLRGLGPDNGAADRLQKVYDRLCRLDINLALSYANE